VILIDSNIIIDILEQDELWFDWSAAHLSEAILIDDAVVNQIVVAEVAPRKGTLAEFTERMSRMAVRLEFFGAEAAFVAGNAFLDYRRKNKRDGSILADFFVGGHAQSIDATIMTRDPRFYRAYFPNVPLITPETHP